MYTDKKNILQLVALLEAHGITKVVLCPGSRNTPIVHTLSNHPNFTCYAVTDERSAGYFAIGLALNGGKPAAVCCTSGTALLNLHPAVAEAFYQNVPLVVISADRPAAWIGQMDGQTVPQPGVFQTLVKKSVNLPEIHTEEDEWYCNRLVNEALLETNHHGKGPVHINVPVSEPLFQFTVDALPEVRVITRYQGLNVYDRDYNELVDRMNKYQKRMIIIGQMNLIYLYEKRYIKLLYKHFAWLTEHIGNQTVPGIPVKNFDAALYAMPEEKIDQMVPELLITYGGHVVSKRLKKFLRQHPPKEHWHVSPEGEIVDLYGSLTTVIEMDPFEFLEKIASLLDNRTPDYPRVWENYCKTIPEPEFGYSVAHRMGMTLQELRIPVRRIEPVPHRMQMREHGLVTIIDDAYNSNPVGSRAAVETLAMFDGIRILITPGMVELGDKEAEYNHKFGNYAADCCDYILLVGRRHTEPIREGVLEKGFPEEKCLVFDKLEEAVSYAYAIKGQGHKYILLENDLTDNY